MQIRLSVEPKDVQESASNEQMFLSIRCGVYLEGELFIEDRVEGLPVDLGLKLLLLVRQ